MKNWTIGFSTGCFGDHSLVSILESIRGRFTILELSSATAHLDFQDHDQIRQAGERLRILGLKAWSVHAPFGPALDLSAADAEQRRVSYHALRVTAEGAARLGARQLVMHPGPDRSLRLTRLEKHERLERAAEHIDHLARLCRELGLNLLLENALPHLVFGSGDDMAWLLETLSGSGVGWCMDTGHAFLSGEMYKLIRRLAPHLRMCHIHDNRSQYDDHLPPGQGLIDWVHLLKELSHTGFPGLLMLELAYHANQPRSVVVESAARARDFLLETAYRQGIPGPSL